MNQYKFNEMLQSLKAIEKNRKAENKFPYFSCN